MPPAQTTISGTIDCADGSSCPFEYAQDPGESDQDFINRVTKALQAAYNECC